MESLDEHKYRATGFVPSDHPSGGNVRTISEGHDSITEAARKARNADTYDGETVYIEVVDEKRDRILRRVDPNEINTDR